MLKDAERYLNQVESLSREKQNLRTEVSFLDIQLHNDHNEHA